MMIVHSLIVAGTVLLALSMVSFLSALIERRRPRVAGFAVLVALGLLAYAIWLSPQPLDLWDVPDAYYQTIANLLAWLKL